MDNQELSRIPGVNPHVPDAARIYDYTLGGTHHFEVDRQAAEFMFSLVPSTRKWLRMLRSCLRTAALRLSADGFDHWVDFASGLPTSDHIHSVLPDAKVLYTDINPLTIATGKHLLGDNPRTRYMECDIRSAGDFLRRPDVRAFLDGERRVAFGANGITVFLSSEENRRFFKDLYDWAAPGSKLFATFETKAPGLSTPKWEQFVGMFQKMGESFQLYSLREYLDLCGPWSPGPGGVMTVREFLGLPVGHITEEDREGVGIEFYAVILEKH
ncbi:SAM-dependent methyltransferase [Myxococcus sp. MISCRS1]|uniref:SAM-dependent methyltransferase n=1 Tax=Myxococcus TaxID=32 RepID=UPI001CBBB03C|nr:MULTISPECIES: SAM-dependent methyltransferase [unclassified Myxococcus]MBZ4413670.1 SAM-dependent methyltransferase [Myxococcus sp. XM-1-1-1]MCY0996856.1 SAM-dependent methyltransferase [Myxococcus sp. MISCRS1]BDT33132.1 SAM-dependent methyltransferase [Myxococcus sp. MH1]